MSNFVAGLVRKGAGLPSSVALRPAMGPYNLPGSIEAHTAAASLAGNAPDSSTSDEGSHLAARTAAVEQPIAVGRPRGVLSETPQLEDAARETETPAPAPQMRRSVAPQPNAEQSVTLRTLQGNKGDATPSPSLPPPSPSIHGEPPFKQASRSATTSTAEPERTQRNRPSKPEVREAKSTLLPVKVIPQPESRIVVPSVKPSPSTPQQSKEKREGRTIHVKIGRVEIRSTQPSTPARAARKPGTSGFADLTVARAYLDRRGW